MTEIDITNEKRSANFRDRTGQKIARLTVVKLHKIVKILEYKKENGAPRAKVFWECLCDCGTICVKNNDVLNNRTRNFSCGCFKKEQITKANLKSDEDHFQNFMGNSYARYRCEARNRSYSFNITIDLFKELVQSSCYYCGVKKSQYMIHPITKVKHEFCGVDRIDNRKGYEETNVVSCCKKCNLAKNSITPEMVFKLYNLMKEKGIINE